ncbi:MULTISPECIES: FadR/GntR family transcriptional regulator [Chitinophagaceae]
MHSSDDMTFMQINPIQRKSLSEEVAELLKHKIQSGEIVVGAKLPTEPELMRMFSVGRSTIREAIKYLTQSGFVHAQQGLGTFVTSMEGNNRLDSSIANGKFADVYEVRQILEIKIIEKAAINRTNKHLKDMQTHLQNRKVAADKGLLHDCIDADIAFHSTIADSCNNSILTALYKTLSIHVAKFFGDVYKDTSPFLVSQDLHEELLRQITEKNATKAVQVAQTIIGN